MIITVDGFDGSGKSSLAEELANLLGFTYIDKPIYQLFGVSGDDNPLAKQIYQLQDAVYNKTDSDRLKAWFTGMSLLYVKEILGSQNIIIDRGLMSCYAFNGNETSNRIFEALIDLGVWFDISIFLYVSPENRVKRLLKRNPNDPDLHLDKVMNLRYDLINSFLESHKDLPIIKIDTDNLTEREVFDFAISELKRKKVI